MGDRLIWSSSGCVAMNLPTEEINEISAENMEALVSLLDALERGESVVATIDFDGIKKSWSIDPANQNSYAGFLLKVSNV